MLRRTRLNSKAASIIEYALVLGVVTLAITAMNMYFKRGVQGRLRNLSDALISSEQTPDNTDWEDVQQNSQASTSGATNDVDTLLRLGVSYHQRRGVSDTSSQQHSEEVVDTGLFPTGLELFTDRPPVERDDEGNYDVDDDWRGVTDLVELEEIRDSVVDAIDRRIETIDQLSSESDAVVNLGGDVAGILDAISFLNPNDDAMPETEILQNEAGEYRQEDIPRLEDQRQALEDILAELEAYICSLHPGQDYCP